MRLLWTDLKSFRNLDGQRIDLDSRYNLLIGKNGQGKTNILEAIAYLGTLKSFRSATRSEMIRYGSTTCRVAGGIRYGEVTATVSFALTPQGRVQFLDDRKIPSPEEYLREVAVVSFIPEDVGIVSGSPSRRRKVIDRAVFETRPTYVREYRQYLKVLRHRNALLRRRSVSDEELESWNSSFAKAGAALVKGRLDLLSDINPVMEKLGRAFGFDGELSLRYIPSIDITEPDAKKQEIVLSILHKLEEVNRRERETGHTIVGPHRDNILFVAQRGKKEGSGFDLGRYGSQGQKRVAVLAFKLALAKVIKRTRGVWPLILLDDVASELDPARREDLGKLIRETGAQFIITTTSEESRFLNREEGSVFSVDNGSVTQLM
ncbi:MAG: DNA replication/repair protein RecF [Deltaproteobacteria bacterium]|nr:DNA replication/repair protein RecF [Deltaproteobacteria bacterium]